MVKTVYWSSCKVTVTFSHLLIKLECSRQIFELSSNIKFLENHFIGSPVVPCGRADGRTERQTERRDESYSRFSQF